MSMKSESRVLNSLLRGAPALLLTLAYAGVAQAQPTMGTTSSCTPPLNSTFRIAAGAAPGAGSYIKSTGLTTWSASPTTVLGLSLNIPSASANRTGDFTGTATSGTATVNVTAGTCTNTFTFTTADGAGGWGDPHLTTVDGVKYDFQSAGEFTALRRNGFVVQTRQSPVPTATVPITNPYTGITHCVAIYTAVAAKLGSSRVTVQPSWDEAVTNSSSMQVRVNGKVVQIGDTPYVLHAASNNASDKKGNGSDIDGIITKRPDGVFELTDAFGAQVVVTTAYWDANKVWYLNVNIYGTSAQEGTMGKLAARSWLPALPDGTSLGAKPESEAERYKVLYEKFADAWRVTDATSLFDYEPGTNTATFTRKEWPRNHPQSCGIEGLTAAQTATEEVAQQACANVVDATRRADCLFDVKITGNAGFGKTYEVTQRFTPLPPGWFSPLPLPEPKCPDCEQPKPCVQPWWCCWTGIAIGLVLLALLVLLVLRSKKKP
jgi:hypothetical protein